MSSKITLMDHLVYLWEKHVVNPFGGPINERAPKPTEDELFSQITDRHGNPVHQPKNSTGFTEFSSVSSVEKTMANRRAADAGAKDISDENPEEHPLWKPRSHNGWGDTRGGPG